MKKRDWNFSGYGWRGGKKPLGNELSEIGIQGNAKKAHFPADFSLNLEEKTVWTDPTKGPSVSFFCTAIMGRKNYPQKKQQKGLLSCRTLWELENSWPMGEKSKGGKGGKTECSPKRLFQITFHFYRPSHFSKTPGFTLSFSCIPFLTSPKKEGEKHIPAPSEPVSFPHSGPTPPHRDGHGQQFTG